MYALTVPTELKLHAFDSLYTVLAYERWAVKTTPVQAALGCQGFANRNPTENSKQSLNTQDIG